jgi:esterase/lipase superfamily enzyme
MQPSMMLVEALARIWGDLQVLAGNRWSDIERKMLPLLRALERDDKEVETRNALLDLLKTIDGARERLTQALAELLPDKSMRGSQATGYGGEIKHVRHALVEVGYATDRTGTSREEGYFSAGRAELTFGIAQVSVPDDHRMGALEKPRWWRLEFRPNPDKHVAVMSVAALERDSFIERMRESVAGKASKEALVFVHGYNVTFVDALRRTAQLAKDLDFSSIALAYCWPSEASHLKYPVDEANVRWTQFDFRKFLELCARDLGLESVHIIAHSMGSRLLAETLGELPDMGLQAQEARLTSTVFAAPDIDSDTFCKLAAQFARERRRCTLYLSSKDKALWASKMVHKHARAGRSGEHLVVVPGVDTVDASEVDTSLVGHSYFGDTRTLIGDLFGLIVDGKPPNKRFGLEPVGPEDGRYWRFKPSR